MPLHVIELCSFILSQTVQCGEKYDTNLEQLSELCLGLSQCNLQASLEDPIRQNALKICQMFIDKGGDQLVQNVDVIRRNFAE